MDRALATRCTTPAAKRLPTATGAHPCVLTIVTQNVDDLHSRTGWSKTQRLHGDILVERWLGDCLCGEGCSCGRDDGVAGAR